jgi:hypothetical protein
MTRKLTGNAAAGLCLDDRKYGDDKSYDVQTKPMNPNQMITNAQVRQPREHLLKPLEIKIGRIPTRISSRIGAPKYKMMNAFQTKIKAPVVKKI